MTNITKLDNRDLSLIYLALLYMAKDVYAEEGDTENEAHAKDLSLKFAKIQKCGLDVAVIGRDVKTKILFDGEELDLSDGWFESFNWGSFRYGDHVLYNVSEAAKFITHVVTDRKSIVYLTRI